MNNLPHQVAINNYTSLRIYVEACPGIRILGLISLAYAHTKARPKDTILICPGVGDLLYTDPITGMSSLRFDSVSELSDHITGLLNEGEVNFHKAYPRSHILFGTLTGMELKRYAMTQDTDPYHQYIINVGIARVNGEVVAINERNHVPTPWMARKVHRIRKTRSGKTYYSHPYHHLSDGYHPTTALLKSWTLAVLNAVWHCT